MSVGSSEAAGPNARESLGSGGVALIAVLLVTASGSRWTPDHGIALQAWRLLWLAVYAGSAARLLRAGGARWAAWALRREPACCALLALAGASFAWSLDPRASALKAISLLGTTVVGWSAGTVLSARQWMRVLEWTFVLLVVSGTLLDWLAPAAPMASVKIGWRGIGVQPNTLGAIAAFGALFFLVLSRTRRAHPAWSAVMLALSLLPLAMSRSRTSWAIFVAAVGASAPFAFTHHGISKRAWRRLSLALVAAVGVVPFLIAPYAPAESPDDPLNGRLILWKGARWIVAERPWTGYGYAAVWGRGKATLLPQIGITAHRSATTAHNGVVDVATELGIPGAVLAGACLFAALSDARDLVERAPSSFSLFALAFAVAFTVMSFGEANLIRIHSFFWILFVGLTTAARRALDAEPLEAA